MARARKSHEAGEEKAKSSRTKLKPAYASNVGGNHLVVYADLQRESDPYARVLILNFAAEYAARHMIDLLIHNDEWEWVDPLGSRKCIKTTGGVRVSMFGDALAMLLDYKMSEEEKAWSDDLLTQNVLRFKYGVHEAAKKSDDNEELEDGAGETLGEGRTVKPKSKRKEPRAPKEPKVKVDKSGYVSANDIAKELKVEGREVRGVLRGLGLTKPDIGWAWPKDSKELKDIRAKIEKGLKEGGKKKKGKK
jgi:hypothetical protein